MDESFVRDELFLLTVMGESAQEHAQLAQAAARVWPKVYGHARVLMGDCAGDDRWMAGHPQNQEH